MFLRADTAKKLIQIMHYSHVSLTPGETLNLTSTVE
jgi:hypothetical protein